jgi:VCBS repeat-containing protein
MLVRSRAATADERKAVEAPLPRIGKLQAAARFGRVRHTSCAENLDPRRPVRAGRFGMLWLTALAFAFGKQAQAAEPGVTILDDGNIAYKDLEHGSFELITKEVIPRHILVDDPGQTITLRSQGSSVGISQSTNSAARMAELQAAQQDTLATLEQGLGFSGSSSPPSIEKLPVQPINFIQNDGPSPEQDLPAMPGLIFTSVTEVIVAQNSPPPPAPPTPPTLNTLLGPTEIDTSAFDFFTATSGTFLASSPNSGATLTFGIEGGTAGSTAIEGVIYDVSRAGPYGTLYVNSTTGDYTFVPNNAAINALTEPTTTDFLITVSDGTLSADEPFTVAINGTNDAAVISGITSGTATEAGASLIAARSALRTLSASGTLTSTDVDDAPNTFTAVDTPTSSTHGYGTFTMTEGGVWTYTVDDANPAVQALNVGDTLTDYFTVTTIDGTAAIVTVLIKGANDAAIISGATTGSVAEDGGTKCDPPTASGTLTAVDVDDPTGFKAVDCPTTSDGGYGTFTMTADGVWTYTLGDDSCAVQALNVGDKLIDCFTVTTIDGTPQVVTITINGANDAAIICGDTRGSVIEAGGVNNSLSCKPSATGKLTDTDVDNANNTFTPIETPKASTGGYGTFTMTADGVWTYKLDNTNCEVQQLNDCDTLTDTFTVTTIDGTAQVVTITINGTDDAFHFKDRMSDAGTSDAVESGEENNASIRSSENSGSSGTSASVEVSQPTEMSAQWHHSFDRSHAPHDLIV